MSSVNLFMSDGAPAEEPVAAQPSVADHFMPSRRVLRRTGSRPFVFEGAEIIHSMSYMPGSPLWYDLTLYRARTGGFVLEVKLFYKESSTPDRFSCHEFSSIEEVAEFLEEHDASQDVHPSLPMDNTEMSAADFALHVAGLRLRVEEARGQFADLAGEMLYSLSNEG